MVVECTAEHAKLNTLQQPFVLRKEVVLFVKFKTNYNCKEEMLVTPAVSFVYVEVNLVLEPTIQKFLCMH
jgi:hypothetical protein